MATSVPKLVKLAFDQRRYVIARPGVDHFGRLSSYVIAGRAVVEEPRVYFFEHVVLVAAFSQEFVEFQLHELGHNVPNLILESWKELRP